MAHHGLAHALCTPVTSGFVFGGAEVLQFSTSARQGGTDTTAAGAQAPREVAGPAGCSTMLRVWNHPCNMCEPQKRAPGLSALPDSRKGTMGWASACSCYSGHSPRLHMTH